MKKNEQFHREQVKRSCRDLRNNLSQRNEAIHAAEKRPEKTLFFWEAKEALKNLLDTIEEIENNADDTTVDTILDLKQQIEDFRHGFPLYVFEIPNTPLKKNKKGKL